MNPSNKRDLPPYGIVGVVLVILFLGWMLSSRSFYRAQNWLLNDTAEVVGYLADTINPRSLEALRDSQKYPRVAKPQRLEGQLEKVLNLDPKLRSLAIIDSGSEDGPSRILLQVGENGNDLSTTYEHCLEVCGDAKDPKRIQQLRPPDTDNIMLACTLVAMSSSDSDPLLIVVEIDTSDITRQALRWSLVPGILCLVWALGLALGLAFRARCQRMAREGGTHKTCRHDAILTSLSGVCLTLLIASQQYQREKFQAWKDFGDLAAAHEFRVADTLLHVRDLGTQAIAGLMSVSNNQINLHEFQLFDQFLTNFTGVSGWAWVEPVKGEALERFEAEIRKQDQSESFTVFEISEHGERRPVSPREVHYPIRLVTPLRLVPYYYGYDLAANPDSLAIIEQAIQDRLPIASAPQDLMMRNDPLRSIVVYQPVFSPEDPDQLLGLALAGLPVAEIIPEIFRHDLLVDLDLFVANNEGGWDLVVSSGLDPKPLGQSSGIRRLGPLTLFGNTYAIRSQPRGDLSTVHLISQVPLFSLITGLLLTALATGLVSLISNRQSRLEAEVLKRTQKIREGESRYDILARESRTYTWEVNSEGVITFINPIVQEILGYRPEELVGKLIWELHPEESREAFRQENESKARDGLIYREYENPVLAKDGRIVWVSTTAMPIHDAAGTMIGYRGWDMDIDEFHKAQEKLELLAQALDAAANLVVITDRHGTIEWVNRAFTEITGYATNEAIGKNPRDLVKSGEHDREFYQQLWAAILSGEVWSGEIINRKKDGTLYPEEVTITPVKGADGVIHHFIAIKRDLTQEKLREKQLMRAQRMESIAVLAGGIAHDLNNALAPVLMSVDMIRRERPDENTMSLLDVIEDSTRRSAALVRQVLLFAEGMDGERISLNPAHLLRETEKFILETFPKAINLHTDISGNTSQVLGDPTQIRQVILNLCVNARDAMPDGGKLYLSLSNVTETETSGKESKPRQMVKITVRDTGVGIPAEIQDRIFDPFFTTHGPGKSTGLGLSTSHSIIKGHGGHIRMKSNVGQGATFEVFIPALVEAPRSKGESSESFPEESLQGHSESILLVDDEPLIRKTVRAALEDAGYEVYLAGNGKEALKLFRKHQDILTLVITDLAMPELDGVATIKAIQAVKPGVRIIATSGQPMTPEAAACITHFLHKPYNMEALLRMVREVIEGY